MKTALVPTLLLTAHTLVATAPAQAPGVPITDQSVAGRSAAEQRIVEKARALRTAGKTMDGPAMGAAMQAPAGGTLLFPEAGATPLPPAEIARRARAAAVQLGWCYLCKECDDWHANLAGGYAVTADGVVVTCAHVLAPEPEMREGIFIAVNASGEVLPVTGVLACDDEMDAAAVRVAGTFSPLPLTEDVRPGDPVWCLSAPFDQREYFSSGIVNRFYWTVSPGADERALAAVRHLRLNVSTDWAPGSSGSAVLDSCGNAIGHVAVIAPLSESAPDLVDGEGEPSAPAPAAGNEKPRRQPRVTMEDIEGATPLIILHEAVPARSVHTLLENITRPGQ